MKTFRLFLVLLVCTISFTGLVSAQVPDEITGLTLETKTMALEIGETYRFTPKISSKTGSAVNIGLHLFSSDENVVKATTELNTIEAVGGGEAEVYIYTAGYEFSAVCAVKVSGEAKSVVPKGDLWEQPTADQLAKIHAPSLAAFFEMLGKPEMADTASILSRQNKFSTLVRVTEGRAGSLGKAMKKIGMDPVYAFETINTVSVRGTAEQYVALLKSENILSIDEDKTELVSIENSGPMEGQAETISHFKAAYDYGLSGKGSAVAIVDTGVFADHEQFTGKEAGKIIYQACFTQKPGDLDGYNVHGTCANGTGEDLTSSWISNQVQDLSNFEHGTHVAAIAAGKDGVAPGADIIAVNVFSEFDYPCDNIFSVDGVCIAAGSLISDQLRAFEYLNDLMKNKGVKIAAVNLSLGGAKQTGVCAKEEREAYFKNWLDRGIIATVASGNEKYDGAVDAPGCAPSAFTVGALWDSGTPEIAEYSNHSKLVSILAPGTMIRSAVPYGTDTYDNMSGSSMAAPMVAGSIAMLREKFPEASSDMIKSLLSAISGQTASRAGVEKPVLSFAKIQEIADFIDNGPEVKAYGGDKFIQLDFSDAPLTVNYTLTVNEAGTSGKTVKTYSGKNLKTIKLTKLTNNTPYKITVECSIPQIDSRYQPYPMHLNGMAMTQGKGYELDWYIPGAEEEDPAETANLKFSWTPEENAKLLVNFEQGDTTDSFTTAEALKESEGAAFNQLVTADFYKTITIGEDTYLSLPVTLQTLPLTAPTIKDFDYFCGKIWIDFGEPIEGLTGREILITDYETGKQLKDVKSDVKKNPSDVLITGVQKGTFVMKVRNYAQFGKTVYYSDWYQFWKKGWDLEPILYFLNMLWPTPNKDTVFSLKDPNLTGVSVTSGDNSVTVTYNKNLLADGYNFLLKPIEPNLKKFDVSVEAKKALNGAVVSKLTNGTVYKMNIRYYCGTAKKPMYTNFYPTEADFGESFEDNSWKGIVFIPMPVPAVNYIDSDQTLEINADGSVDTIAIVKMNGNDPASSEVITQPVVKGKNIIDPQLAENERSLVLMYVKEYDRYTYYGPAVYVNPIIADDNEMNLVYGAKFAEAFDLNQVAALRGAAQLNGSVVLSDPELQAKSAGAETTSDYGLMLIPGPHTEAGSAKTFSPVRDDPEAVLLDMTEEDETPEEAAPESFDELPADETPEEIPEKTSAPETEKKENKGLSIYVIGR